MMSRELAAQKIPRNWLKYNNLMYNEQKEKNKIIMRYNIALLPKTIAPELLAFASAFGRHADYILQTNSLPHITLTQFYAPHDEFLETIWADVNAIKSKLFMEDLKIQLGPLDYKIEQSYVWLQLLIKYHPICFQLHHQLAQALQNYGIQCLNAAYNQYCPHLTLARSQDFSLIKRDQATVHFEDAFYIALGKSDPIGQFVEILQS